MTRCPARPRTPPAAPGPGSLGAHRHDVTFQMFYVLKGWGKFHFEGTGEVEVTEGTCVHMPPGIVHDMLDHSDDFEFIEGKWWPV